MFLLLSNVFCLSCVSPTPLEIDTGDLIEGPQLWITLSWDEANSWPVGAGNQLWLEAAALSVGGVQFIPCLDFNAETNSADELTIELNLSEDLVVLRSMSLGPYAFPIVEICEIYFWYGPTQTLTTEWPVAFHGASSLALIGEWGGSPANASSLRLYSSESFGRRVRLEEPILLSGTQDYRLTLYRDRQFMLWPELLASGDGDAFLETMVRETQLTLQINTVE